MDGAVVTPVPPQPFTPQTATLGVGAQLYRVFSAAKGRTATTFNPGAGAPTRFAFFGTPVVPIMYAAAAEDAAVAARSEADEATAEALASAQAAAAGPRD